MNLQVATENNEDVPNVTQVFQNLIASPCFSKETCKDKDSIEVEMVSELPQDLPRHTNGEDESEVNHSQIVKIYKSSAQKGSDDSDSDSEQDAPRFQFSKSKSDHRNTKKKKSKSKQRDQNSKERDSRDKSGSSKHKRHPRGLFQFDPKGGNFKVVPYNLHCLEKYLS